MVDHPFWRTDVENALALLVAGAGDAPEWPTFTDAVHWLIDDTGWDHGPPSRSIGPILRDDAEAAALAVLVDRVCSVLDDLGPTAPAEACFADPRWPRVLELASEARALMRQPPRRFLSPRLATRLVADGWDDADLDRLGGAHFNVSAGHDERVHAAVVRHAAAVGLSDALALALTDWRDVLVAADLAHDGWPGTLDDWLG